MHQPKTSKKNTSGPGPPPSRSISFRLSISRVPERLFVYMTLALDPLASPSFQLETHTVARPSCPTGLRTITTVVACLP